jgi:hypothetical protein
MPCDRNMYNFETIGFKLVTLEGVFEANMKITVRQVNLTPAAGPSWFSNV